MRIAMLVENPLFFGGGEVHAFEISRNLVNLGHDVDFIQLYGFPMKRKFRLDMKEPNDSRWANPPVSRLANLFYVRILWLYSFLAIPLICRVLIKGKYDILHVHGFGHSSLLVSAVLAKKVASPKIVCTLHNDLLRHINRELVKYLISHVDAFIAVSSSIQQSWLASYGVKPILIPNGVDTSRFSPKIDGSLLRKKLGLESKFVILSVCRLSSQKGIHYLLQALDYLKGKMENLVVLIGGRGEEESRLKEWAEKHFLLKIVRFVGFIPPDSLPMYYAACDLFVLPSVFETFALTLLEALSTGKPVVCAKVGGAQEIAGRFEESLQAKLVNPGDSKGLAEAIVWFANNQKVVHEKAKDGYEIIRTNYAWESVSEEIDVLYRRLTNEHAILSAREVD
jgi:glycosyltransferase involved in cell wall biosynthesis